MARCPCHLCAPQPHQAGTRPVFVRWLSKLSVPGEPLAAMLQLAGEPAPHRARDGCGGEGVLSFANFGLSYLSTIINVY